MYGVVCVSRFGNTTQLKAAVVLVDMRKYKECFNCGTPFSMLVKKRHCHQCGHVVCGECSKTQMLIKGLTNQKTGELESMKKRVCNKCMETLRNRLNSQQTPGPSPPPRPKKPNRSSYYKSLRRELPTASDSGSVSRSPSSPSKPRLSQSGGPGPSVHSVKQKEGSSHSGVSVSAYAKLFNGLSAGAQASRQSKAHSIISTQSETLSRPSPPRPAPKHHSVKLSQVSEPYGRYL